MTTFHNEARFHSISFPSEWGLDTIQGDGFDVLHVSIQLVSPASGDSSSLARSWKWSRV